ncbi:hypothetical protein HY571_01925 [Candidatus Micrarchaeota archaeon]|nr:hypothetical protein [Candidatus Micrarchaeota archaeon]
MTNYAVRLTQLKERFARLKRQRPKLSNRLKSLTEGGRTNVDASKINKESRTHVALTRRMLGIIDKYAALHRKIHGNVRLTQEMADELNRFAIHRRIAVHPHLSRKLARAVQQHHESQASLFRKAEEIRARHEILVPRVHR